MKAWRGAWCVVRESWIVARFQPGRYLIGAHLILPERRSSDRRSPIAQRLFANADLKIGVPKSSLIHSVPSLYHQPLNMLDSRKLASYPGRT
jgi:hypothetical protein